MVAKIKDKTGIVMTGTFVFLGLAVVLIVLLLIQSVRIRQFKVDVFVLCNESNICVAEGPDGKVKVHDDNLPAIYTLLQKSHGKAIFDSPAAEDSLTLSFDCHDEKWTMAIDKISDDIIRMSLSGPTEKTMYFKNNGSYDSYARAVSLAGYNAKNKALGH